MMANFNKAITLVLQHEGGFVDDPSDAGGATNFGICQRDNPNLDIPNLTKIDAIQYYYVNWWQKYNFEQIIDDDLASYWFDHAVNVGIVPITRIIQKIVGGVEIDGEIGPNTIGAVNLHYQVSMLPKIQDALWNHYEQIIAVHPEDVKFKNGWNSRCYSL